MILDPEKKRNPNRKKIAEQQEKLRDSLWPNLAAQELWHHDRSDGWLNVPRALPIVLRIMDMLADKGKPVSATYLDLWCRTFNNSFVIASHPREMAYFSGFTGERAEHTWRTRIRKLVDLGFIRTAEGATGKEHYILILNPFRVILGHIKKKRVNKAAENTLRQRMIEVRANDLDSDDDE